MESQQVVDYIGQQLNAGHTEASLRQHLATHGWSQAAIDDAFTQHGKSVAPRQTAKSAALRRGRRLVRPNWSLASWITLSVAVVVVAVIVVGAHMMVSHKTSNATAPVRPRLSYGEMQARDINIIAGAVGQYAASTDALPLSASASSGENLLLCSATCDATAPEVVSLSVYKAAGVKLVPYTAGLAAPDKQTMYLVPAAKCASVTGIGGPNTNPRSMVILYARVNGTTVTQRCVTL